MKKGAKIISVVLSVAMVLSLVWAFAVNSLAADAPVFAVKEVSKKYNTVTVEVNLLSGSFNALDLNFIYSRGVKLKTIEQGSALKTSGAMAMLNPNANTSADQSHASMIAIDGYNQKGQMLVATFQVPFASDYSISVYATDCRITVGKDNDNVEVKPTVKESVSYKYEKPTTSTTKSTTTTTTKAPNQPKPNNPTNTTNKTNNGTTIRTAVIPGGSVTVASGSGTTAQGDTTTSSEPTDENLDIDEYSSESTEYSALSSAVGANAKAADKIQLKQSHNKKTIIIVVAAAAVLIAGAVVAIVLINKKKNNTTDTF